MNASERVISLILVLMNSPRPLLKTEIFELLPAYKNASKTRPALERMFARDKALIRELGCNLVVREIDGDFEYKVVGKTDANYITVNKWQRSLINLISRIWEDDEIGQSIELATKKLLPEITDSSSSSENNEKNLLHIFAKLKVIGKFARQIVNAIDEKKAIKMQYLEKTVNIFPLQLVYPNNNWYLLALDITENKLKTYKIERIMKILSVFDYDYEVLPEFDLTNLFSFTPENTLTTAEKINAINKLNTQVVRKLGVYNA
jgi:predicted DNA-binding transcriptional regulator YafY